MAENRIARTIQEFASHTGLSEAEIVQAMSSGDLEHIESATGVAAIEDSPETKDWIHTNRPARIIADLAGSPKIDAEDRMQLLAQLPHLARQLVSADYAAITIADRNGRIKEMIVSGMSESQAESIGHPPIGRGVLGSLDKSDAPLRLANISSHPRSTGFPEGHPDMHAMIGVGITAETGDSNADEEFARMYVTRIAGQNPFTPEDQALIESLATFAKQALDFDSLRKQETGLRIRAEQAEIAKTQFMSMINHDLRNPVAAMQVAIETASINQAYAENQFIEDLKSSLSLQNTLISSLLDMAHLGETIDDYDVEDTYPIDLVQQCVRRQQMSPLGKNRKLEIDVPDTLPAVRCDPVQMGRVFDNLVSNALKYSEDTIEINANVDGSKKQVMFNVIDQGIGVPESERTRIFEPFERINETTRPIEGLGLGLAICRSIVEAHSGNITHTNNTNLHGKTTGSTFTITLPLT